MTIEKEHWQCLTIAQLSSQQLLDIMVLRSQIFVVEQNCVYQDPDQYDAHPETRHLFATVDGKVAAYLRVLAPGTTYPSASLGRVVVGADYRGDGLAKRLLARGLEELYALWPTVDVEIGAQTYLQKFYASFGFEQEGDGYLEDGIPHLHMRRKLAY